MKNSIYNNTQQQQPITIMQNKKINNLFYIKSKHTQKYFYNHPYFQENIEQNKNNNSTNLNKYKAKSLLLKST